MLQIVGTVSQEVRQQNDINNGFASNKRAGESAHKGLYLEAAQFYRQEAECFSRAAKSASGLSDGAVIADGLWARAETASADAAMMSGIHARTTEEPSQAAGHFRAARWYWEGAAMRPHMPPALAANLKVSAAFAQCHENEMAGRVSAMTSSRDNIERAIGLYDLAEKGFDAFNPGSWPGSGKWDALVHEARVRARLVEGLANELRGSKASYEKNYELSSTMYGRATDAFARAKRESGAMTELRNEAELWRCLTAASQANVCGRIEYKAKRYGAAATHFREEQQHYRNAAEVSGAPPRLVARARTKADTAGKDAELMGELLTIAETPKVCDAEGGRSAPGDKWMDYLTFDCSETEDGPADRLSEEQTRGATRKRAGFPLDDAPTNEHKKSRRPQPPNSIFSQSNTDRPNSQFATPGAGLRIPVTTPTANAHR